MNGCSNAISYDWRRFRGCLFLLLTLCLYSPFGWVGESDFRYDKRLVPVARTYNALQLCSNFAFEFERNETLANRYLNVSQNLYEASEGSGWTPDEFASALVVVQRDMSSMDIREGETLESFSRHHYSGKPCDNAMGRAETYLEGELPKPDSAD